MEFNHKLYDKKTGKTRPIKLLRLQDDDVELPVALVVKPSKPIQAPIRMPDLPDKKDGRR